MMDDQISRQILENFDVTSVENSQHEIHKISGPGGVLKGIENGSLHFITVPTRDSEYIDHSLLHPEYITTHIANGGFIIDLMENPDGSNDHTQPSQFISETITNDLQYPTNDENDRRLTATFFQLVKSNGSNRVAHGIGNGETQVIVTNKDVVNGLTEVDESDKTESLDDNNHQHHNFLTIEDQQTYQHTLLNDGHFKIFQTNSPSTTQQPQIQLNSPPLPQLTPIRRLSRQRKNSITNNTIETTVTVQNLKTNDEMDLSRYQRPMTKKVLPHKKRITKKLKAIDRIEPPPAPSPVPPQVIVSPIQQQQHQQQHQIEFYETTQQVQEDESININASQFACQLCGLGFASQLDFFSHLKEHYEPIKADNDHQNIIPKEQPIEIISKKEPTSYTTQELHEVDLQFTGFDEEVTLGNHQHPQHMNPNQSTSQYHHPAQYHHHHDHHHHQIHHSKLDDLPTEVLNLEHKIMESISTVPPAVTHTSNISSTISNLMVTTSNSILIHQSNHPDDQQQLQHHLQVHRHPQHHLQAAHQHHHDVGSLQTLTSNGLAASSSPKGIVLIPQDEVEFSDTEDMLEGIRGVVDKVQESVDDTGDEMDMISPSRLTWYANSALNGEMNFKAPRLQNLNNVDNYQIFFKNDDLNTKQEHDVDDDDDLQHNQQQLGLHNSHEQQSENDLIHSVITGDSSIITENSHEIIEMELTENSVLETLPMSIAQDEDEDDDEEEDAEENAEEEDADNNDGDDTSVRTENLYSNHENTSEEEYSSSMEYSPKRPTMTKKRRCKRRKRAPKYSLSKQSPSKQSPPKQNPNDNSTTPTTPRPRGRPAKIKKDINVPAIPYVPAFPSVADLENINKESLAVIQQCEDSNYYDEIDEDAIIGEIEGELADDYDDEEVDEKDNPDDGKPLKKNRKKYVCQKCNKVFNSINALKYHDFSHTGERPHQCDICGKSFFALNALRAHLRVHSGEKPFNCEECGRAFRQWGDLTYHKISLHSNERNFQCEFCGKAFARKYSLVIHRRIHTQERNYKCEFCPKTFRASSYLQNHRKIHTGEKPYICETCDKKFRVCGDLKRHQKIHEREKKFTTHLSEIITTEYTIKELNPIDDIESEVNNQDKENETITTTYYYTETNINNLLKTDSNGVTDVILISENDEKPSKLLTSITTTTNNNNSTLTISNKPETATNKKPRKLKETKPKQPKMAKEAKKTKEAKEVKKPKEVKEPKKLQEFKKPKQQKKKVKEPKQVHQLETKITNETK